MAHKPPKLVEIENELEELQLLKSAINVRIERLEAHRLRFTRDSKFGVKTKELCFYVERWMLEHGGTAVGLAEDSGVSDRTIRNILSNKNELTREYIADQIMTVMGYSHVALDLVRMEKGKVPEPPFTHYEEE
jgi:hypothetical protein